MIRAALALLSLLFGNPEPAPVYACDPIETADPAVERSPYSDEERRETYRRVRAECLRLGASADACTLAVAVAARESSGRAGVRHRLSADRSVALRAWIAYARRYGWLVTDDGTGRKRARPAVGRPDDADSAADEANPYYREPERWSTGLGAHGLQPAIHVWRLDPLAPPEILCVPEESTRAVLGIWYRAAHNYGAVSWVEANAVFAGAVEANRPRARPGMDRLFCERVERWGLDCHDPIDLGTFRP